jgi:hypothetical protein
MEFYLDFEGTQSISILHKYSGINQNLFSSLINNELWFNDPLDFNDPYDCNLNYDFSDVNYEKVYNHLVESNEKFNYNVSMEFIQNRAREICKNPTEMENIMNDFLKNTINKRGITCFSESDDALLMWSHYSDSHKGVCLTFDIEKDQDFFSIPYKVDYPANYPKIDPFIKSEGKEVQLILATKSQEWAYEREVRVVKEKDYFPKFRGTIAFNQEALTEIKFGYRASGEQIRTIRNLVSKRYPHIKLYKSKIKTGMFGIEFYPIN